MLKTRALPREKSALRGLLLSLVFLFSISSVHAYAQQDPGGGGEHAGGEGEGQLNCFEVWFPSSDVRAIVPNYPDMGPAFAARMRTFAKRTFRGTVLEGENELSSALSAGSLYGIEFDWFFVLPPASTTGLPSVGPVSVYGTSASGEPKLFAQVFGYDAAGYAARKAMIEDMVGHPMVTYALFAGDLVAVNDLSIAGSRNALFGPLHANADVGVTGRRNRVVGPLVMSGRPELANGNLMGLVIQGAAEPIPTPLDSAAALRSQALAGGTYAPGELTIDASNLPPAGIVFAEGPIRVMADDL
ncbi:MAG TPA: hypothetical protein ENJ09_07755, partial [Planctomycetes bacterium]|nr:hypothetical protein [Planctomycetota bacterium]